MNIQCVITGVVLVSPDGLVAYNGDLFDTGDHYIVNCNELSAHTPAANIERDVKWIQPAGDHWERRGVWVMKHGNARLSVAALEYIGK